MVALSRLTLSNFRNYASADIHPSPGINLVTGQNAQGKTNLLEAVYLVSTGRLLRSSKDGHGVREGSERGTVRAVLADSGTELAVELRTGIRKRATINGHGLARASDLLGRLPTVTFSTQDLAIVTGEPSDRRHFLDTELAQQYPAYLKHLGIYKRALEQRNALLRDSREGYVPDEVFEAWEAPLAMHGAAIRVMRNGWISEITADASGRHEWLGAGESLAMHYAMKDDAMIAEALQTSLSENRRSDIARGATTFGPHRDELEIEIAGRPARYFGSQGQQRTAVIAIKLATLEAAKRVFGFPPVLLLDDIFSDLDEQRRSRLVEVAEAEGGQVFLTCTEPSQAGPAILRDAKIYRVESGTVQDE